MSSTRGVYGRGMSGLEALQGRVSGTQIIGGAPSSLWSVPPTTGVVGGGGFYSPADTKAEDFGLPGPGSGEGIVPPSPGGSTPLWPKLLAFAAGAVIALAVVRWVTK